MAAALRLKPTSTKSNTGVTLILCPSESHHLFLLAVHQLSVSLACFLSSWHTDTTDMSPWRYNRHVTVARPQTSLAVKNTVTPGHPALSLQHRQEKTTGDKELSISHLQPCTLLIAYPSATSRLLPMSIYQGITWPYNMSHIPVNCGLFSTLGEWTLSLKMYTPLVCNWTVKLKYVHLALYSTILDLRWNVLYEVTVQNVTYYLSFLFIQYVF